MGDHTSRPSRLRYAGLGGRTMAIILVLFLGAAAADRLNARLDLSGDQRFTLNPALIKILAEQTESVELVSIWENGSGGAKEILDPIGAALHLMATRNSRLGYRHIDPVVQLKRLEEHAATYGERSFPAIYLCRSGRAFKIPISPATRSVLQREVGGGLQALADPRPPAARFLQGHGELRPGGGAEGIDGFVRSLELGGIRCVVGGDGPIDPEELLILAGPTSPLGTQVTESVEQHLVDGGALFVLADDRIPADLARLLRNRGVLIGPGIPAAMAGGDSNALLEAEPEPAPLMIVVSRNRHAILREAGFPYPNLLLDGQLLNPVHPATSPFANSGRVLLSRWTTPIFPLPIDRDTDQEVLKRLAQLGRLPNLAEPITTLLSGAPGDVWTIRRQDAPEIPEDLDQWGPIPLALSLEYAPDQRSARQGEPARLVIWGSRSALTNETLALEQFANADLAVSISRWLMNRGRANPIPPTETAVYRVEATDDGLRMIMALLVAVMPCLAVGAAILTWLNRR